MSMNLSYYKVDYPYKTSNITYIDNYWKFFKKINTFKVNNSSKLLPNQVNFIFYKLNYPQYTKILKLLINVYRSNLNNLIIPFVFINNLQLALRLLNNSLKVYKTPTNIQPRYELGAPTNTNTHIRFRNLFL